MQIECIKVSNAEVTQAVKEWLRKNYGLTVQIASVTKRYTHLDGWEVNLVTDDKGDAKAEPSPSIVEQILAPPPHIDSLEKTNQAIASPLTERTYTAPIAP